YGGESGQQIAIEQRKRLYNLDPNNIENAGQLARMYIMSKDWDQSKAIIDDLRAKNDSLGLVELEATWNADQGMVGGRNGLVIANELFASYIDSLEPPVGDQPYIANAEFMLNRGRPDLAVVAANEAVKRQDPKTMLGTKLLGDLYARINNLSKAVVAYQEVIDQDADPDFSVHMKQINTLTRLGRYEEAQALFDQLPESMTTKLQTMILASDIATGLGDHAKASKLLNDLVARYPSDAYSFIKRAQSMVDDKTLLNDVLADIDRALELNPNDWRAYRVRAAAYFNAGRSDDALKDLRTTIRMNPSLNKSIFAILNELLDQPGGAGEAIEVAREVVASRPDDATMMAKMAGLFAAKEEWEKASELYGMAWNKRHGINDGAIYIDSLVRQSPPDAQTATAVINEIAKMVGDINKSAGLLAAQALVLQARGRDDFAKQQLSKSFDLSVKSDAEIVGWSGNLSRYFEGQPMKDQIEFLETLKRRNSSAAVHKWLDMFIAQRMAREDDVDPRCFEILTELTQDSTNPTIQLRAFKLYGSVLYEHKRFEEAATVWTDGLGVFSDDWEMNNNLAYVLSKELGENEKALEYGQKAIDKNLARSEAYETMAGIYLRLGKYDEAEQMIDTGSNYIRTIPARISMLVTTGRLHLARNELVEARSSLSDSQSILRSSSTAYPSLKEDIDSLEQEIDSADE
ncbi:MAG: tetratricopeptide repeat protein, partial [Phycisphaerales bacterium]